MEVPKNIFQTWKTSIIPSKWHEAQTSVIKKNPKWRYILLTDEDNLNIVSKYFPDSLPYYKSFRVVSIFPWDTCFDTLSQGLTLSHSKFEISEGVFLVHPFPEVSISG